MIKVEGYFEINYKTKKWMNLNTDKIRRWRQFVTEKCLRLIRYQRTSVFDVCPIRNHDFFFESVSASEVQKSRVLVRPSLLRLRMLIKNSLSINFLCQAKKMSPRTEMNPLLDFSPTSISENHFSLEIILRRHSSKIFSRIRRIQLFGIIYIFDEDSNYRAGMNEHASRSRTRT